jgi:hypothetical protein
VAATSTKDGRFAASQAEATSLRHTSTRQTLKEYDDASEAKTARSGKTTKSKAEHLKMRYQSVMLRNNNLETDQTKIAEMVEELPEEGIQAYIEF